MFMTREFAAHFFFLSLAHQLYWSLYLVLTAEGELGNVPAYRARPPAVFFALTNFSPPPQIEQSLLEKGNRQRTILQTIGKVAVFAAQEPPPTIGSKCAERRKCPNGVTL